MKNKWLYILFSLFIVFSSCIKDELPNVEADIEDIMIPQMNAITSSRIDESRATVYLRKGMVDLENLQPSLYYRKEQLLNWMIVSWQQQKMFFVRNIRLLLKT